MSGDQIASPSAGKRCDNLFSWLTIAVLLAMTLLFVWHHLASSSSASIPLVALSFVSTIAVGLGFLWQAMAEAPFSLKQIHWIFYTTFLAIIPLDQCLLGTWPWGYSPDDGQILLVNFLVLLWGVVFAAFSGRPEGVSQKETPSIDSLRSRARVAIPPAASAILPLISLAAMAVLVYTVGAENLFLRTEAKVVTDSGTLSLIIGVCSRGLIFGSFAIVSLAHFSTGGHGLPVLLCGALLLLTCFPTAVPRFLAAAIYLGLAILFFPSLSRKHGLFAFLVVAGFFLAYPALDAFKYLTSADDAASVIASVASSLTSGYTSGNYDAYSIMFWCLDYVDSHGVELGGQLLGSLLFFVPRSIWPTKPVPSGELVFTSVGYYFTDMSFSLPWEGYINFGIVGLVGFAALFALIAKALDGRYWAWRVDSGGGSQPSGTLLPVPALPLVLLPARCDDDYRNLRHRRFGLVRTALLHVVRPAGALWQRVGGLGNVECGTGGLCCLTLSRRLGLLQAVSAIPQRRAYVDPHFNSSAKYDSRKATTGMAVA